MRHIPRLHQLLVFAASVGIATMSLCDGAAAAKPSSCTAKDVSDSEVVRGFSFRIYDSAAGHCLKIFRAKDLVYSTEPIDSIFTLGRLSNPTPDGGVLPGTDLTGRGHPDMLVSAFSGGAHCCTTLYIFELGPDFRLLQQIPLGSSDLSRFRKDPHDHRYYLRTSDETFAYWHSSFAESPLIPIFLEAKDDGHGGLRFGLALNKMKKPAPTDEQWRRNDLKTARAAFQKDAGFDGYPASSDLWRVMLDRIYAGQDTWAWKTLDAAWPAKTLGKEDFLKDFCHALHGSPYWPDLQSEIKDAPGTCAQIFQEPVQGKAP